ncbi:TPA: YeeE/YedE family protein [Legionella pneumophila]|nr:YeeE/YedE family protein [Legionella pneumophila]
MNEISQKKPFFYYIRLWLAILGFIWLELTINLATEGDVNKLILAGLGLSIGSILFLSRFGFALAFKDAVTKRYAGAFVAQLVMLSLSSLLIVPLIAAGSILGRKITGFSHPIGISFVTGAMLFGCGMSLSGGCASGTLFWLGSGNMKFIVTLLGFVFGSVLAAASIQFWWHLPSFSPLTVFTLGINWRLGLAIQIIFCLLLIFLLVKKNHRPTSNLLLGGIGLALFNFATVLTIGHPWSETFGFTLWGSKLAAFIGFNPQRWAFWNGEDVNQLSVFSESTSIMDLSIILGAFLAATITKQFKWNWPRSAHEWLAALIGGIIMGYGSRLSGGCNIGAYFSSISSGDLSGWIWALCAFIGTFAGVRLSQKYFLD